MNARFVSGYTILWQIKEKTSRAILNSAPAYPNIGN